VIVNFLFDVEIDLALSCRQQDGPDQMTNNHTTPHPALIARMAEALIWHDADIGDPASVISILLFCRFDATTVSQYHARIKDVARTISNERQATRAEHDRRGIGHRDNGPACTPAFGNALGRLQDNARREQSGLARSGAVNRWTAKRDRKHRRLIP
jgi:hypothetical protein